MWMRDGDAEVELKENKAKWKTGRETDGVGVSVNKEETRDRGYLYQSFL